MCIRDRLDINPQNTTRRPRNTRALVEASIDARPRRPLLHLGAIEAAPTTEKRQRGTQHAHLLIEPLLQRRRRLLDLLLRV
eukprot:7223149-Alexandrium_andersonii.AAC.1